MRIARAHAHTHTALPDVQCMLNRCNNVSSSIKKIKWHLLCIYLEGKTTGVSEDDTLHSYLSAVVGSCVGCVWVARYDDSLWSQIEFERGSVTNGLCDVGRYFTFLSPIFPNDAIGSLINPRCRIVSVKPADPCPAAHPPFGAWRGLQSCRCCCDEWCWPLYSSCAPSSPGSGKTRVAWWGREDSAQKNPGGERGKGRKVQVGEEVASRGHLADSCLRPPRHRSGLPTLAAGLFHLDPGEIVPPLPSLDVFLSQ